MLRHLKIVGFLSIATLAAIARGQSPEPINAAYEQLPTAWDQTPALNAEPLPPADAPADALIYPPSMQPPVTPTPATGPMAYPASMAPTSTPPAYVAPVSAPSTYAAPMCVHCGDACTGACAHFGAYPPHSFWFSTAELTILHPSYENGFFALDDDDDAVAPRLSLGWESPRGLGLRSRFWWLNEHAEIVSDLPLPPDEHVKLQSYRFDFDAYRRFTFDGSSIALGGGLSVARMGWELDPIVVRDAGAGVSFFAEGRHELYRTPVSQFGLIARGRWASLIGEWRDRDSPGRDHGDSTMEILEAGFGWDWVRNFRRCDFVYQHIMEAQTWQSTLTGDVGFFGQSVSVGLRW